MFLLVESSMDVFFNNFLKILYVISLLVVAEGAITKYPEGKDFVDNISSGSIKFMQWHASNNAKSSLKGLSKLLLKLIGVVLFCLFVSSSIFQIQIEFKYTLAFMLLLYLWSSINAFFDPWGEIKKILPWFLFIVFLPFVFILANEIFPMPKELVNYFKYLFGVLDLSSRNNYLIAFQLSLMIFVGGLVVLSISFLAFLFPAVFIFFLIYISSKLCNHFLIKKPIWLYYFFVFYSIIYSAQDPLREIFF